jgi:hypothetical protein
MRKPLIITVLIGGFISLYIFYPIAHLNFSKNTFTNLVRECEKSKKDLQSLDIIGEKESIETRVNLFINAKANEFSCFDLELLENELLAKRVSQEKINYLKLKSIASDPKLIENIDSDNQ